MVHLFKFIIVFGLPFLIIGSEYSFPSPSMVTPFNVNVYS